MDVKSQVRHYEYKSNLDLIEFPSQIFFVHLAAAPEFPFLMAWNLIIRTEILRTQVYDQKKLSLE